MVRELEALLDAKAASKALRISLSTLRRWTAERRVPHVKLGRRALYSVRALCEFVALNERPIRGRES